MHVRYMPALYLYYSNINIIHIVSRITTLLYLYTFRVHELFKAKLGLLGHDADDSYLTAFFLKVL